MVALCNWRKREVGLKSKRNTYTWALAALASLTLVACTPIDNTEVPKAETAPEQAVQVEVASGDEETDPRSLQITVTYFTPPQTEGPFYPTSKPEDRDNDLVVLEGAEGLPAGEILEFGGTLYDGSGLPVAGAVVEIWQTDDSGIYLHPGDSDSSRRDVNFQSYGEAVTLKDGSYSFRTIMPGGYDPRPRHIHVKILFQDSELLTTQFYFSNDPELANDRIFTGADEGEKTLIMEVEEGLDVEGNPALIGRRDIVLRDILSE